MSRVHCPRNLIIGQPGVGKTTLVEHMQARGYLTFDGDLVDGLGIWQDADGTQTPYQPDRAWRDAHRFSWQSHRLTQLILQDLPDDEYRPLYLFGAAPNIEQHSFWFHNIVALHADAPIIWSRLKNPARKTPYPFELEPNDMPKLQREINKYHFLTTRCLGYTAIDANRPVPQIADDIIAQCSIPFSSPRPQPRLVVRELLSGVEA